MSRRAALVSGLVLAFIAVTAILIQIMPKPLGPTDYLVIGAAATLFCLALLLVISRKMLP